MKIAITSGKDGSGKTFIATHLARILAQSCPVSYIDCDVVVPGGYLLLQPETNAGQEQYGSCIESVNMDKCILCGKCSQICYQHAITIASGEVVVSKNSCRYCGACEVVCKNQAMIKGQRLIGKSYRGLAGNITVNWGQLADDALVVKGELANIMLGYAGNGLCLIELAAATVCRADMVLLIADAGGSDQRELDDMAALCRAVGIEPQVMHTQTVTEINLTPELNSRLNDIARHILSLTPEKDIVANHIYFVDQGNQTKTMRIDKNKCRPCGDCLYICQFGAVSRTGSYGYEIDRRKCEGCRACQELCPSKAISESVPKGF